MGGFGLVIRIGHHHLVPVLDSVVRNDPTRLYAGSTLEQWADYPEHLGADGRLELFMGGYVLRTGDRLVLIDAGVGPDGWTAPSGAVLPGGFLVDNLRVAGFRPEEFTDVVLTHLHPDHIGWTSSEGEPVFANATYRCARADWRYFVDEACGDPVVPTLLEPIADRFEPWEGADTLLPGVDVTPAPGHTPGSSIVVLSSDAGERAMLLGDVVHCPVELLDDEWATFGDVDPVLAKQTRVRVARELEGTDTHIAAAHFAGLEFGRLLVGGSRRRWALSS
jgi:glyoxylase-like metal-dependent hydrolase (beta-lactamase superfamily II)